MIVVLNTNVAQQFLKFRQPVKYTAGLEITTDTVANATNILPLATKNSGLAATLATRFLYDLHRKIN